MRLQFAVINTPSTRHTPNIETSLDFSLRTLDSLTIPLELCILGACLLIGGGPWPHMVTDEPHGM